MFREELKNKSRSFALRIINLYKYLCGNNEFVLSKQILRSGTSIGANISEAECASSEKDFLAKMYISFKECSETLYWLDLLYYGEFITKPQYDSLLTDAKELYKILSSITKTTKDKLSKKQ